MRRIGGDQRLAVETALKRCGLALAQEIRQRLAIDAVAGWSPPSAGRDTVAAFWSSLLSRSSWVRSLASIRSWNPEKSWTNRFSIPAASCVAPVSVLSNSLIEKPSK
jgi:hypothetical protein